MTWSIYKKSSVMIKFLAYLLDDNAELQKNRHIWKVKEKYIKLPTLKPLHNQTLYYSCRKIWYFLLRKLIKIQP